MQQKIASNIQNPAAGAADFWTLKFSIKSVLVASQILKFEFRILVLKK